MEKIKIITDSTCDLTPEIIERFGIAEVVPMEIFLGEKGSLKDGTFDVHEIYDYVKATKQLPQTSAANEYAFTDTFKRLTADGSSVLHFAISTDLSATCGCARAAAENFENVYVVDARQLSTGTSLLMLHAVDMLKANPEMTAKEAAGILSKMGDKTQTSFVVDTIDYLYKGGRCSALSLLGANLLKLHPSLHVVDGKITVGKKYRGKMTNIFSQYIQDLKEANPDYDDTRCFITYTQDTPQEVIDEATACTKKFFNFKEILHTTAGSTITCHCGKGTLGLLFMKK